MILRPSVKTYTSTRVALLTRSSVPDHSKKKQKHHSQANNQTIQALTHTHVKDK
jgi:hypothetical protein